MSQLKAFVKKGDFPKANMLAKQIALYRNLSDKNFERSVSIQTEVQVMLSNQKINRAHAESIKGIRFANGEDSLETVREREIKYERSMQEYEAIEEIMNEGFDEIYDHAVLRKEKPESFEQQTFNGRVFLEIKNYRQLTDPNIVPASLYISTLDLSVDMLKQQLLRDKRLLKALGLIRPSKDANGAAAIVDFQIGDLVKFAVDRRTDDVGSGDLLDSTDTVTGDAPDASGRPGKASVDPASQEFSYKFVPFDITESLKSVGIKNGGCVWILPS
eukprot:jgi/Hompol1/5827/HPOL_002377-RA